MTCTISEETIEKTIEFHGHSCPGLAIGIRASELALRELGPLENINLVAVSETDMCGVDAIQAITGCTYGKGNFMHRDYGKMAFSFYDRNTGSGIRAVLKTTASGNEYPEMRALMAKDLSGQTSTEEKERLTNLRADQQNRFMTLKLDDMFEISRLTAGLPRPAMVLESLTCEGCGESVMESRTRRYDGKTFCIPCFSSQEQKI